MAVSFDKVSKSYSFLKNEISIIQELSFNVEKGDFLVIKGPSGSGKTTILRMMTGLSPVSSGMIKIFNQNMVGVKQEQLTLIRSAYVGIVFQDFQLIQTLTCLENVMLPLELAGELSKNAYKEAKVQLVKVGLDHRFNHYPVQLSGGEQQRVAWARAFINQPDLLVADEPTANLDQVTQKFLFERLEELKDNPELTVIISTHEHEIEKLATCLLAYNVEEKKFVFQRISNPPKPIEEQEFAE